MASRPPTDITLTRRPAGAGCGDIDLHTERVLHAAPPDVPVPGAHALQAAYVSNRTDKVGRFLYKIIFPLPVSFAPGYKPLNSFAPVCELADTILMSKAHLNTMGT